MCDCLNQIQKINSNDTKRVIVDSIFLLTGKCIPKLVCYITEKKKDGTWSKQKATTLFPSYCPFCGAKYESESAENIPFDG